MARTIHPLHHVFVCVALAGCRCWFGGTGGVIWRRTPKIESERGSVSLSASLGVGDELF